MVLFSLLFRSCFAMAAVCALAGCGGAPAMPEAPIDHLETIYSAFDQAAIKLGRAPQSLNDLKPFLPADKPADEWLTSPHDGLPYVLVWNVHPHHPLEAELPPLLAYEQRGSGGQFDALTIMGVMRVSEAELNTYKAITPGTEQQAKP